MRKWGMRLGRDTVLFVAGLVGVVHETFLREAERPALLVMFAGMLGLPAFLGRDEVRRDGAPSSQGDSSEQADAGKGA